MTEKVSYRTSFAKAFHRTLLVAYIFYVLYHEKIVVRPEPEATRYQSFGGKYKFITVINIIVFQLGYFSIAALNDLVGTNERIASKMSFLQRIRDVLFTTVVFPSAMFVSSLFWGLYNYNRELIFPLKYDSFYPSWMNHFEHSLPGGAVLLEMLLVYHKAPKGFLTKIILPILSFGAYLSWLLFLKFEKEINVYPFFAHFTEVELVAFLLASAIPVIVFLFLGTAVNRLIWGPDSQQKKKDSKKNHKQNNKSSNNKKQNNGKKGNANQSSSGEGSKKQKNTDLESAKKRQKIIEEPEKDKKKQKNNTFEKKNAPNSISNQNVSKNKRNTQDTKTSKSNKKTR